MDAARAYDAIPYPDTALPDTHPNVLGGLATLFGLTPVLPKAARILELGCANGGNLIHLAHAHPQATLLGIEISPRQVESAQQAIRNANLNNLTIRQGDILELEASSLGSWDYIIAHGVYSWVPAPVRQHMMALIGQLLTPHGIAYISYNTLPGWYFRGALREMLLLHTQDSADPMAQIAQARELLSALEVAWGENDALSVRHLRHEAQQLLQRPEAYLFHEYLSPDNTPVWFRDFVAHARSSGLEYVCDVDLARMEPSGMGRRTEANLRAVSDPITRWQQLDMVLNRNFRQSLLCQAGQASAVCREIQWDRLDPLSLVTAARPTGGMELRKAKPEQIRTSQGERLMVMHPVVKAALMLLAEHHPRAAPLPELLAQAHRRAAQAGCSPTLLNDPGPVFGELGSLLVRGALRPVLPD